MTNPAPPRRVQRCGANRSSTWVRARSKTASRPIGPGSSMNAAAILGYSPVALRDWRYAMRTAFSRSCDQGSERVRSAVAGSLLT
ncbi:hypothetical protein GA0115245_125736 [Streptomyces sp. di188]|nr:hypothetical protein GA0115238_117911 [Streptomyces sp. di50b]SCE20891.1 hypothetical protein GA0115245_125736 [Streptomyces sp. di188]